MLATPPRNANGCLVLHSSERDPESEVHAAVQAYVTENGYAPPMVLRVAFDEPPAGGWPGVTSNLVRELPALKNYQD